MRLAEVKEAGANERFFQSPGSAEGCGRGLVPFSCSGRPPRLSDRESYIAVLRVASAGAEACRHSIRRKFFIMRNVSGALTDASILNRHSSPQFSTKRRGRRIQVARNCDHGRFDRTRPGNGLSSSHPPPYGRVRAHAQVESKLLLQSLQCLRFDQAAESIQQ